MKVLAVLVIDLIDNLHHIQINKNHNESLIC